MAAEKKKQESSSSSDDNKDAVSDQEIRQESSKAANAAASAQKKAKELREAAAGAGDPDERQKLMEQAIDKEIEAESFGKTAKYLRSGAFQGMAIGAGLGTAPSATLGAFTGTLVGGVTTVITGGLGGGIGAAAGALHGPVVNMGELAGKGVRKITGDPPGWVASPEQKQALEKMVGQIKEEDMLDEDELKKLREDGGDAKPDETWLNSAKGMLPSMNKSDKFQDNSKSKNGESSGSKGAEEEKRPSQKGNTGDISDKGGGEDDVKRPRKLGKPSDHGATESRKKDIARKKPRKLETRSDEGSAKAKSSDDLKPRPQKLEKRSS